MDIIRLFKLLSEGSGFECKPVHHIFQQLLRLFSAFCVFVFVEVEKNFAVPSAWVRLGDVTSSALAGW